MHNAKYIFLVAALPLVVEPCCFASSEANGRPSEERVALEDIRQVLAIERHLENPISVTRGHENYRILAKQMSAIKRAGETRLSSAVPELIYYLDYVENSTLLIGATPRVATGRNRIENARRIWPAYDAILSMGAGAVAPLEAFVQDGRREDRLRLAAFQVLCDVDYAKASEIGRKMLQDGSETESRGKLGEGIGQAIEGKSRFWGVR